MLCHLEASKLYAWCVFSLISAYYDIGQFLFRRLEEEKSWKMMESSFAKRIDGHKHRFLYDDIG